MFVVSSVGNEHELSEMGQRQRPDTARAIFGIYSAHLPAISTQQLRWEDFKFHLGAGFSDQRKPAS